MDWFESGWGLSLIVFLPAIGALVLLSDSATGLWGTVGEVGAAIGGP